MGLPINLPTRLVRGKSAFTAEWGNSIREAISRLAKRKTPTQTSPQLGPDALPFEISALGTSIRAAAGVVDDTGYDATTEEEPADGTWYFEVSVTINSSTGAFTGTSVGWVTSASSDTSTVFYSTLGEVEVMDGVGDLDTLVQYNYGPILVFAYGTQTDKWGASIF